VKRAGWEEERMPTPNPHTRIKLSDERRKAILDSLPGFYREVFDDDLSRYRAERLLEFFLRALGPAVYNEAIQDARRFMLEKLEDLDVEFYDPGEGS
jgi:uncharacterized protein (DUF2164 family)